ncbi:MAG TPA: hypothetical protein QGH10_18420, partial [Armatimonadota bacterium]|nr:hypothetical protein [Armatimonadota bacterium]
YACADGLTNYYLFRWFAGTPEGTWLLLRMSAGRPARLGVVPGDIDRRADQRLSLAVVNGLVDCKVDGQSVITVADSTLTQGQIGLGADGGKDVKFSDITVRAVEDPYRRVNITKQFTQEDTMADWARAGSDWPRDPETGIRWFRLPVFNDMSLRLPFRLDPNGKGVILRLGTLGADNGSASYSPEAAAAGLEVTLAPADTESLHVACRWGGTVLGETIVEGGLSRLARIDKTGPTTRVWIDDEPVLAVNDSTWLDNSAVGLWYDGPTVNPNQVEVHSTHMPEWTFSGAPTDWRPTLGTWQVTDRWSCFPGWAWFGGTKHQSPLVWSKQEFYGDQTFEFWAALEMDTTPAKGGYTRPSDINCTIAGDGENLCSGYSFVFAGNNNTVTKIMRGNTVVAETDKAVFVEPSTRNMNFHRHWFHVKVVKFGAELHMSVDGKWVLNWRDPKPLHGGHVGVWSYNNGILIARARASSQFLRRAQPHAGTCQQPGAGVESLGTTFD